MRQGIYCPICDCLCGSDLCCGCEIAITYVLMRRAVADLRLLWRICGHTPLGEAFYDLAEAIDMTVTSGHWSPDPAYEGLYLDPHPLVWVPNHEEDE